MHQVTIISSTPITDQFPSFKAAEEFAAFWRNRGFTAIVK